MGQLCTGHYVWLRALQWSHWVCGTGRSRVQVCLPLTKDGACLLWDGCRLFLSRSHRRKAIVPRLPLFHPTPFPPPPPPSQQASQISPDTYKVAGASSRLPQLCLQVPHHGCLSSACGLLLSTMHCANSGDDLGEGQSGNKQKVSIGAELSICTMLSPG